jgi:putative Holliday junction resolvase
MKVLAIDYGTVRVGIAVSYVSLAQPLVILENDNHLLERISDLVEEHRVEEVIVGESETIMAGLTREFAKRLQEVLRVPVTMIDETLSSYQVHEYLRQHLGKRRKNSGRIDHLAAAVILQNYLDDLKS